MNMPVGTWRARARRLLNIVGVAAAGTGLAALAGGGQVFAHQFLQEATPVPIPAMAYSPELQLMVKPGTDDPVFSYSRSLLRGKANGEYQVAPLVTCPGDPSCPSPPPTPTHTVTPGGGPNGPGPTSDSD